MEIRYTKKDVINWLGPVVVAKAQEYLSAVSAVKWRDPVTLTGSVKGTRARPYDVVVRFYEDDIGEPCGEGECSCPVAVDCKHAAALLLAALDLRAPASALPPAKGVRPELVSWLRNFQARQSLAQDDLKKATSAKKKTHSLAYLIGPSQMGRVEVTVFKARLTREGAVRAFDTSWNALENAILKMPSFVENDDVTILRGLLKNRVFGAIALYELRGPAGTQLLERILATGRAYGSPVLGAVEPDDVVRLARSPSRPGKLAWRATAEGRLRPVLEVSPPASLLLATTQPCWYVDCATGQAGPIDTAASSAQLEQFLDMPLISIDETPLIGKMLQEVMPELPAPPGTPESPVRLINTDPKPVLVFDSLPIYLSPWGVGQKGAILDFARVSFDYGEVRVMASSTATLHQTAEGEFVQIQRHTKAEATRLLELQKLGFIKIPHHSVYGPKPFPAGIMSFADASAWPPFIAKTLPSLRAAGWQVEMAETFQHNLLEIETIEGSLADDGNGWFDVEMGITVHDRKVRLEPLLADLFVRDSRWLSGRLESIPDNEMIELTTDRKERLTIAASRIKPVVRVLIDLFDNVKKGGLRISTLDAGRIEAIENLGRWQFKGDSAIRQLAQRLVAGPGVADIAQPAGLMAQMRPYQRQGLAWMQFLREQGLAGVLADDLGLGQTLHTLAHLLTEKENGRLDRPALVVMPTTLIHNWCEEARRFAPGLRVLDLHGSERHERFKEIPAHDLVLTTYPLVWRDEAALSEHEYHLLILDEAQYVKNAGTKAATTVRELRARHRLCLSGTPLENHLGELWSQFDFLLPGFLGTQKDFTQRWRNPIEKGADTVRRNLLARRIRPFMLRRRKNEVATELPAKTVITRTFEIEGGQRDLYETVRAAMQEKVRAAISEKGLNRSQIVVLDALLKLRQVCCDPRLVKTSQAATVKESAKLDLLLQMLPELIEEGRRILLFSQFAGMLALIAEALDKAKIAYAMMTGETTDRPKQIQRFTSGEVPLFLISLRAGGVGLNLTAADTVIHYDPWWNPAAENQATDRAHRIGQDKPVFVYKLITAGSVEEKILAMQDKKAALAQAILSDDGAEAAKFSTADLNALFEPIPDIAPPKRKRA